ncbi:MAG: histidine phosphatase family protein [Rhizobiales bacterium]|nr:histidine phosphatase family protein [Hyphomicrobiales bacterium]NRB15338.1 histidine phosphatase family protein [Hyphomicrobiales bacterium]
MTYPKIYLMRHGETEWNLQKRMQGQLDSPLTPKGQAQAVKMGHILNREIADPHNYHMYTSPLGRTMHTSELVAQNFEFKPNKSDLLMEIYAGSWGGKLRADIMRQNPHIEIGKQPFMSHAPDGETLDQLSGRGKQWLDSLTEQSIVVSHGQIGFAIRALYTGLSFAEVFAKGDSQDGVYLLHQGEESFIC